MSTSVFLSIRRVCVFHSGEWSVKATVGDPWLYRTPGASPPTGSFCSTTHWSTPRYTQEYVLQLHSSDILLQFKELPQHPPGVCYICLLKGLHVYVVFFNHSGRYSLPASRKYIWHTVDLFSVTCCQLKHTESWAASAWVCWPLFRLTDWVHMRTISWLEGKTALCSKTAHTKSTDGGGVQLLVKLFLLHLHCFIFASVLQLLAVHQCSSCIKWVNWRGTVASQHVFPAELWIIAVHFLVWSGHGVSFCVVWIAFFVRSC